MKKAEFAASHWDALGRFRPGIVGQFRMPHRGLLAIEEIEDHVPDESLVAASGVVFAVQDLHRKMMRIINTECN